MSDSPDLATLAASDFEPHTGSAFRMAAEEGDALDLELIEVAGHGGDSVPEAARAPFSIVFRGPEDRTFEQQICALEHEQLGRLELFLVPLGPDDQGMRYEAIFC